MRRLVSIIVITILSLSLLVGCGGDTGVASKDDVKFLTKVDTWYFFNPQTFENEVISFSEDFNFYWGCECGEYIGDSDIYKKYDYDKDEQVIIVYNGYDNNKKRVKVIDYSDYHLMIELDGVIKDFIPYATSYEFAEDDTGKYLDIIKGYNSYVTTMEVQGSGLVVGPADYDGDLEYFEEDFTTYMASKDIEFYNYSYEWINGKESVDYRKMSMDEGLAAFESSSAFIWFNKNMEISKVMYYGSLIVSE